jgi:thiamine pyrophosphate-dependent acetolactate synthase large subunit-like protein
MQRMECLERLAELVEPDDLIVTALGGTSAEWHRLRQTDSHYANSCMGANVGLSTGLALALPHRRVVLLDTDGCQLMTMGALATLGNVQPPNLRIFVFDNGGYGYTGGQASATRGRTDLAAVARSVGVEQSLTVHDLEGFEAAARRALSEPGLHYVVAKIDLVAGPGPRDGFRPPTRHEQTTRFMRYVERTEGVQLIAAG